MVGDITNTYYFDINFLYFGVSKCKYLHNLFAQQVPLGNVIQPKPVIDNLYFLNRQFLGQQWYFQHRNFSKDVEDRLMYWETDRKRRLEEDSNKHICDSDFNEQFSYNTNKVNKSSLTHIDLSGRATMVNIGDKIESERTAKAGASIYLGQEAFNLVKENKMKKGDVLTVSQLAGIMAAKRTSELIPLCHNILLSKVDVQLKLNEDNFSIEISSVAKTTGKTGVEMEAIMAVTMAAITVYDMCKAVSREMVISGVRLLNKTGGVSGDYEYKAV